MSRNADSVEIIENAYRSPKHRGRLSEPTHHDEAENPMCGDIVSVDLRIVDGHLTEARFDGRGCVISQAAAELMMERVRGMSGAEALALGQADVLEELGLKEIAPARLKCALLPLEALKAALRKSW